MYLTYVDNMPLIALSVFVIIPFMERLLSHETVANYNKLQEVYRVFTPYAMIVKAVYYYQL